MRKFGCSINVNQIAEYKKILLDLDVIVIEDPMQPGFLDSTQEAEKIIQNNLKGYKGKILIAGPFIDLNYGSPERLNIEITKMRFLQAYEFAKKINAKEIIFLSQFIPIVYVKFYEEDWLKNSINFWKELLNHVDSNITFSIANTFEFNPDYLVKIVEAVNKSNFQLALELGHCLAYSKIPFEEWWGKVKQYCTTIYVHSNDGLIDTHDEPFRGILGEKEYFNQISKDTERNENFIAAMFNKDSIKQSIDWIKSRLN